MISTNTLDKPTQTPRVYNPTSQASAPLSVPVDIWAALRRQATNARPISVEKSG